MKRINCFAVFLSGFALLCSISQAAAQEFFKGKSVTIVVGNSVGGAQDDWARFIAQYLGKHIPGNPTIVVQNMPGAGTIIAANHIYNIAKPDGLSLGLINPGIYIDQLLGAKEVRFDWPRFSWIGSPERIDQVHTRHLKISARRRSRQGARLWREPPLVISYPSSLRRGSGLRLIWYWVTAAAAK
jgi:hypothetical protein